MPLVKSVEVVVKATGTEDAKLKISEVEVKAEELKKLNPTITPQIDSAKALIQARLLREGLKAELSKVKQDVVAADPFASQAAGKGSFLEKLLFGGSGSEGPGGAGTAAASNGSSLLAGGLTSPVGIAAIAAGVSALLPEIAGVVSGFAAATAGAGAFFLLAHPAINNLTTDYKNLDNAQTALQLAQNKYKIDPTATTLKGLQTAQLNLKAVQMSMGQDAGSAVGQMQKLAAAWDKVTAAFQPTAFKVFADGLKVVRDLLPAVLPMATAFGGAIDKLLKQFDKFAQSKGFQTWLGQFDKLIGPSVAAIGHGVDLIITQLGKLITRFSGRDVAHAINIFFDTLFGLLAALVKLIGWAMTAWDKLERFIVGSVGVIINALAKAFAWAPVIGPKLAAAANAFNGFEGQVLAGLGNVTGTANSTSAALAAVGYAAVNAFNKSALVPTAGNATPHAAGGPAGGLILVGERGPEVLRVPTGSYVYNNQQTRGMLSGSSGGATYNIHVSVPVSANKRDVGRQVVEAIKAFEHGSGSGWRK